MSADNELDTNNGRYSMLYDILEQWEHLIATYETEEFRPIDLNVK